LRHNSPIQTLCFAINRDTSTIITGDNSGALISWNTFTRRKSLEWVGHRILHGVFHLDVYNGHIISQGREGVLKFWDENMSPRRCLVTESSGFCRFCVGFGFIVSPGENPDQLFLYKLEDLEYKELLPPPISEKTGMCMCVKLISAIYLLALFENGTLYSFNVDIFEWVEELTIKLHDDVPMRFDVVLKVKNEKLENETMKVHGVSCSAENYISAFSLDLTNKVSKYIRKVSVGSSSGKPGYSDICIRNDCRIFACASWSGDIHVIDWYKMSKLATLRHHKGVVSCLAFSSDNLLLASGGEDSQVALWSLYPPKNK